MNLWLQLFLAGAVALVLVGAVGALWLLTDWLRRRRRARSVSSAARSSTARGISTAVPGEEERPVDETDAAPPVVRGGLDYRDHPGPVVERRGPDVTERRYRDAIDRTSGENPRT